MTNLQHRQQKIKDRRKQTSFREFLMEIASRRPVNFYKNNNNISVLPPLPRSGNVVSLKEYYESYDDVMEEGYGKSAFLADFQRLFIDHIKPPLIRFAQNENSDYCHCGFGSKNAYLSFVAGNKSENILYSTQTWDNVTNAYNSSLVFNNSSNVYHSRSVSNSYNIFYSQYIYNSSDMRFCSSCIGCQNCIECYNLENRSYCIQNTQYTKEQYEEKRDGYDPNDYDLKHRQTFDRINQNFISENSEGQGLYKCVDVAYGFNAMNFIKGNNIVCSDGGTDGSSYFYDCMDTGTNSHHFYGICYGGQYSENVYIGSYISESSDIYYSYFLESCSFCLGCIGLKNKSFCILNKQYTKEERYEKVDEIFTQMDSTPLEKGGRGDQAQTEGPSPTLPREGETQLGQFFPASMNPFYFNDTAAYLIDDTFTKEEVTQAGYLWRDEPIKVDIPTWMETVQTADLTKYEGFDMAGDRKIDESILKKVIIDEEGNSYRIIKMEYDFLTKYGLPLPRKHRLTRIKENFKIN